MLSSQRTELSGLLLTALGTLAEQIGKATPDINRLAVEDSLEKPRQAGHGDVASNIALRLAKVFGMAPPKIAQSLVAILGGDAASVALIDSIEVAGPGFINFRLTARARAQVVMDVAKNTDRFGFKSQQADAPKVLIEFVSANPTGPLHVGHGRQAALGDVLADILTANGLAVSREFYYNDAGAQINNLAISVQARARGISPDDPAFPADGYRGEYIAEIASAYCSKATARSVDGEPVVSSGDTGDLELIRKFAVSYLRHEQDLDLRAFGVRFDRYYLESSLYTDGRVQSTVQSLVKSGHTYEQDGALWLRTTDFGDDKDRVMRKSDGTYTYFVPDIAYHVTKWERSFARAINIQGSDHHGTVARVRAGLQALGIGIPKGYPDYVLHKMVTVMRAGEEVKISKRAGSYVTLRDLIVWSGGSAATDEQRGRDAVRFFLVSRKADSEFVFDVDLALSRSEDNPVYYVQYAHARSCSVLAQAQTTAEEVFGRIQLSENTTTLSQLSSPKEQALLNRLSEFPEVLSTAGDELAPHLLAFYLRELSADFHGFYNSDRVLVDDPGLRLARLALTAASGAVIANGLRLLGVCAPVRM